jgi:hypothetical protein
MALVDDIFAALTAGAQAGAAAASTAAKDLTQDVRTFVIPHLHEVAVQVASIVTKRLNGTYSDLTAKTLIDSEEDAIQAIVETMVALTVLESQQIVNAVIDSLNKAVNTALGFTLLL